MTAIIAAGAVVGVLAITLARLGNPANMGFCIACFLRDVAGGLGLHRAAAVQYLRPEIAGLTLGAALAATRAREFRATGGSSPVLRFVLGILMMTGALTFLGCPLRLLLRLGAGDLNALVALPGYVTGVYMGTLFLKSGFSLGRSQAQPAANAYVAPVISGFLLVLLLLAPALVFSSSQGPGAMRAPLAASLVAGLVAGALAQRSRLCTMGGVRDFILFRDLHLFAGMLTILVVVLAGNLLTGGFALGFAGQPVAHADGWWNFLGMVVVGLAAVLAGGCPLRQLVLSGEGQGDALVTVLGLVTGAALLHNFGLTAGPAGVPVAGRWAVMAALALLLVIGWGGVVVFNRPERQPGVARAAAD